MVSAVSDFRQLVHLRNVGYGCYNFAVARDRLTNGPGAIS